MQKKTNVILSAVLFTTGIVFYIISFRNNHIINFMETDWISGFLMVSGLLIFLDSLKKTESGDKTETSNEYAEIISNMKKRFSELDNMIYGSEDEGKEEISITSEKLGKFVYRRKPEWYEAKCDWCGLKISVRIHIHNGESPEEWIKRTEKLFDAQKKIDAKLRMLAKQRFEELKQGNRLPDELSGTKSWDFAKRPTPLSLDADSGFELEYADSISKSDCSVTARISADCVIERVDIVDGDKVL